MILVLGGSGQLGTALKESLPKAKTLYPTSKELNLTSGTFEQDLFHYCEDNNVKAIINCAAYTDTQRAEKDIDLCFKINYKATRDITEVCLKFPEPIYLIHISSDYVVNPIGVYALSKLGAENIIKNSKVPHLIIRTSTLFHESTDRNLVAKILNKIEDEGKVTLFNNFNTYPTHASDLGLFITHSVMTAIEENPYSKLVDKTIYFCNPFPVCPYTLGLNITTILNLDSEAILESVSSNSSTTAPSYLQLEEGIPNHGSNYLPSLMHYLKATGALNENKKS